MTTTSTHSESAATTTPESVLVIGATGRTGRHVVTGLLDHGIHVRAMARTPITAGLPDEVEVVQGDLDDPASVASAAKGADAAFLLWHTFSSDGSAEVVAALADHVGHVVYLSAADLGSEDGDRPMDGVWADIEAHLEEAPVTHTFVRGGGFAANTLEWAEQIRSGDTVRMPFPRAARSLVDERDLAAVSVRGLVDPELVGAAVSVTGPRTLTQEEQVHLIGAAVGRTLAIEEQSRDDAQRELVDAMGEEFADAVLTYGETLETHPEPPRDGVQEILGRPPHSFADWATHHAPDFERLTTAEVGRRYADGFRTGDLEAAGRMLDTGIVRVAPLETDGEEVEVRGLAAIAANADQQIANVELDAVDVGEPLVGTDSFAIKFTFHETRLDTGERQTTSKISLCTVAASRIVREEVFYFGPPHD